MYMCTQAHAVIHYIEGWQTLLTPEPKRRVIIRFKTASLIPSTGKQDELQGNKVLKFKPVARASVFTSSLVESAVAKYTFYIFYSERAG